MEPVGTFDAGYLLAAIPVIGVMGAAWWARSTRVAVAPAVSDPYDPDADREVLSIEDEARRAHF